MAVISLWVLDTSVNVSMEPFRAFVGDILPESQRKTGYAMQSVMIGAGAVIASSLPYILTQFGVSTQAAPGTIPPSVRYSFYIGSAVLLIAILTTIKTTPEYPPADMEAVKTVNKSALNPLKPIKQRGSVFSTMPGTLRCLAGV